MVVIRRRPHVFGKIDAPIGPPAWLSDPRFSNILLEMMKNYMNGNPATSREIADQFQNVQPYIPPPVSEGLENQNMFQEVTAAPVSTCCNNVETFYYCTDDCGFSAYEINIPDYVKSFLVTMTAGGGAGGPSYADASTIKSGCGGGGGGALVNFPIETASLPGSSLTLFVGQGGDPNGGSCDLNWTQYLPDCPHSPGDGYPSFILDSLGNVVISVCGGASGLACTGSAADNLGGLGGHAPFPGVPGDRLTVLYPSVDSSAKIKSSLGGVGGSSIFDLGGCSGKNADGGPGKLGSGGGGAGTGQLQTGGKGGNGVIILQW
jgi:hypothetical protein